MEGGRQEGGRLRWRDVYPCIHWEMVYSVFTHSRLACLHGVEMVCIHASAPSLAFAARMPPRCTDGVYPCICTISRIRGSHASTLIYVLSLARMLPRRPACLHIRLHAALALINLSGLQAAMQQTNGCHALHMHIHYTWRRCSKQTAVMQAVRLSHTYSTHVQG
jgi:hypothetical protein